MTINHHDRETLRRWLIAGYSYNDAMRAESVGIVDNIRFSESARRAFILLWRWSVNRPDDHLQNRAYGKAGAAFVSRRIDRVRAIITELKKIA